MPIIKARTRRIKIVRHVCHLQEPHRDTLVLYARFIGDTADYVVNQLIETTITREREFVAWRAAQESSPRTESASLYSAGGDRDRAEKRDLDGDSTPGPSVPATIAT